ncbi:MAG: hypothetical protein EPO22_14725 [Dehalococcoidia bacterium]|nr:MAG: hypothetical protein EPO22_14725 [Dehalococcoidia bacterium]
MTRRLQLLVAITALVIVMLATGGPGASLRPSALAADPPPANDNFDSPQMIAPENAVTSPPMTSDEMTTGATLETGESAPCAPVGATVWYVYEPTHGQTVEISTSGSSFDTVLTVYTIGESWYPSPPGANLRAVACNDDSGGATSAVTITGQRYTRYYVQAGGKGGATGALHLAVHCIPGCRPQNDDFIDPVMTSVDATAPRLTLTTDTAHATLEAGEPRPCGSIGATLWYQVIPQSKSDITIDTAGSNFDTVLAVYGLPSEIYPSPPGTLTPSDCNNDAIGRQSRLTVHTASTPIYVQVGGAGGATGSLVVNIACDPACEPTNDDVAQAASYDVPIQLTVHTDAATTEPGEPAPCGNIGRTVWYMAYLPAQATIAVDTSGSSFDTVVAVYTVTTGPGGYVPARNIACAGADAGARARVEFDAYANQEYLIQVGGVGGASGELNMIITCTPTSCPPSNDAMDFPRIVYGGMYEDLDTRGATVEPGEPQPCGELSSTVWYQIPGFQGGRLRVSATDSDYPATIVVYKRTLEAAPPEGFVEVTCGDSVEFDIADENTYGLYRVQVGSRSAGGGLLRLRAECVRDCPAPNTPQPPTEISIETGTHGGGMITLPNTGSGGYLPGAR